MSEPHFTLLARDPCASATITEWCRLRRNWALKTYYNPDSDDDMAMYAAEIQKCSRAEQVALDMDAWIKGSVPECENSVFENAIVVAIPE